jgi:hypothetical protein
VAAFGVETSPGVPGNIKLLTDGVATWEACGYPGKIGSVAAGAQLVNKAELMQCSGAFAHVDPLTGITSASDCAGVTWAKVGGVSVVGVQMSPLPLPQGEYWTRIK